MRMDDKMGMGNGDMSDFVRDILQYEKAFCVDEYHYVGLMTPWLIRLTKTARRRLSVTPASSYPFPMTHTTFAGRR